MCGLLLKKPQNYTSEICLHFTQSGLHLGNYPGQGLIKNKRPLEKVFHYCKPVEGWDVKTESKTALKYRESLLVTLQISHVQQKNKISFKRYRDIQWAVNREQILE